jgi:hypothetical protein
MSAFKANSKAGKIRAAEAILRGLLRTPKTRGGLVAAVTTNAISRNFVFGWLSDKTRDGTVTTLKSGDSVMYQITKHVIEEVPSISLYPSWLDPRILPMAIKASLYIDGALVTSKGKK